MKPQEVTLLLVEDDEVDAETVLRGLAAARLANPVVRARDGIEALEFLHGTNGRKKLQPPYVVLTDLRMPRLDGLGLVRRIRTDRALQRTVIFVLTTSDNEEDRAAAYDQHVAGYIVKTSSKDQYLRLAGMIDYYLLIVSPAPSRPEPLPRGFEFVPAC
jgi:CheY-like chemotaxis protein